jgi:hypothetical protein
LFFKNMGSRQSISRRLLERPDARGVLWTLLAMSVFLLLTTSSIHVAHEGGSGEHVIEIWRVADMWVKAKRFNKRAKKQESDERLVDYRITSKLADWYAEEGRDADSFNLRVKQVAYLREQKASAAAATLFAPISGKPIPAGASSKRMESFKVLEGDFEKSRFRPLPGTQPGEARGPARFRTSVQGSDAEIQIHGPTKLDAKTAKEVQRAIEYYLRESGKPAKRGGANFVSPRKARHRTSTVSSSTAHTAR